MRILNIIYLLLLLCLSSDAYSILFLLGRLLLCSGMSTCSLSLTLHLILIVSFILDVTSTPHCTLSQTLTSTLSWVVTPTVALNVALSKGWVSCNVLLLLLLLLILWRLLTQLSFFLLLLLVLRLTLDHSGSTICSHYCSNLRWFPLYFLKLFSCSFSCFDIYPCLSHSVSFPDAHSSGQGYFIVSRGISLIPTFVVLLGLVVFLLLLLAPFHCYSFIVLVLVLFLVSCLSILRVILLLFLLAPFIFVVSLVCVMLFRIILRLLVCVQLPYCFS